MILFGRSSLSDKVLDMEMSTDTATICIFDTACLAHRKDDVGDWWSLPRNEIQEVASGNALFLNLGQDGTYIVNVLTSEFESDDEYNIVVESGNVFVGPGELVTGGGLEPDDAWGGGFIAMAPGNYKCKIKRAGQVIDLFFSLGGDGRNALTQLIEI